MEINLVGLFMFFFQYLFRQPRLIACWNTVEFLTLNQHNSFDSINAVTFMLVCNKRTLCNTPKTTTQCEDRFVRAYMCNAFDTVC